MSRGCCPAEQHGHLLIGHTLLLGLTHGLTQVDGEDVLAQQALVSTEHSVGKGWARAVVAGHKAGVQTSRASHYLQQIHAKHIKISGKIVCMDPVRKIIHRTGMTSLYVKGDVHRSTMTTMLFVLAASCT